MILQSNLVFFVFWIPIVFLFIATAAYVGAKFALRSYFEDEYPNTSDVVRMDEGKSD